jgi:hypothetical protein
VGKPMTNVSFAVMPSLFLLWLVVSVALILHGLGVV